MEDESDDLRNKLKERIAGEITLSEAPGSSMKKWRELFGVSQVELARSIKVSTSTISDYEGNRRASPGAGIIRRFINALFAIDAQKGNEVSRNLEKFNAVEKSPFYSIHDFSSPISGIDFSRLIDAKIIANPNYLDTVRLFGYTFLDSLRVILEISPNEYPKLFGTTNERAFIFSQVSTGRSPMVVVRVAPIKPRVVVIQDLESVDKLAIKISQIEHIPLLTTKLTTDEIRVRLEKV